MDNQDTPISPRFAKCAILAEKYFLPWIYWFFAWQRLTSIRLQYHAFVMLPHRHAVDAVKTKLFYASLTKDALLFAMMAFMGLMLLISRPPKVLPDKLKHIVLPLAMSYYFLLYGALGSFPPSFRENFIPPALQFPSAIAGVVLSIFGYAISIWALIYLRRSFSILVSVREVVSGGPYAYVRHPIYCGYIFDQCGLLLANSSLAMLFLVFGFLVLLVHRARMEEETLIQASEAYRLYAKHTGFLLPVFKKSGAATSL